MVRAEGIAQKWPVLSL